MNHRCDIAGIYCCDSAQSVCYCSARSERPKKSGRKLYVQSGPHDRIRFWTQNGVGALTKSENQRILSIGRISNIGRLGARFASGTARSSARSYWLPVVSCQQSIAGCRLCVVNETEFMTRTARGYALDPFLVAPTAFAGTQQVRGAGT